MKTIDTPYGRKTPELLCRAMDAYELQRELLAVLQQIAEIPCDHGAQGFCPRTLAREAIAKAEEKVTP